MNGTERNLCKTEDIYHDDISITTEIKNPMTNPKKYSFRKEYQNFNNTNILSEKKDEKTMFNNFSTKIEEEKVFCEICCEDIINGEIIAFCHCKKVYHPNCLVFHLSKLNKNINKPCENCKILFKFASYEDDETNLNASCFNISKNNMTSCTNANTNLTNMTVDTNINNLENYNELNGLAFQMTHEGIAEIISKIGDSSMIQEEIGRIALSPITMTTTPYSGKTKKQISSTQKVEDYVRMQSII